MDKTTFEGMTFIGNIKGEKGDKGDTGASFKILDFFNTEEELNAVENPSAGDAYGVGIEPNFDIYIYSPTQKRWLNNGSISLDISERTPAFTEDTVSEIDNINIESTTTIREIFGKIKRAISELIAHLKNKSNPHNVTTEQIGAATISHTHTAEELGVSALSHTHTAEEIGNITAIIRELNGADILNIQGSGDYYSSNTQNVPTTVKAGYIRIMHLHANYRVVYWRPNNSQTEYTNVLSGANNWLGWCEILTKPVS